MLSLHETKVQSGILPGWSVICGLALSKYKCNKTTNNMEIIFGKRRFSPPMTTRERQSHNNHYIKDEGDYKMSSGILMAMPIGLAFGTFAHLSGVSSPQTIR